VRNWQWSSLLNVNDDQSAQRDKPLDGSTGEAPSKSNKINSDAMAKRKAN